MPKVVNFELHRNLNVYNEATEINGHIICMSYGSRLQRLRIVLVQCNGYYTLNQDP